jgi:hypothetical protein
MTFGKVDRAPFGSSRIPVASVTSFKVPFSVPFFRRESTKQNCGVVVVDNGV